MAIDTDSLTDTLTDYMRQTIRALVQGTDKTKLKEFVYALQQASSHKDAEHDRQGQRAQTSTSAIDTEDLRWTLWSAYIDECATLLSGDLDDTGDGSAEQHAG